MVTTSVIEASNQRVAVSFSTDNTQIVAFLSQVEFLELLHKMFDYRDAHKDELLEVIRGMSHEV